MSHPVPSSKESRGVSPRWILAALLLGNAACFFVSVNGKQEPHRWQEEHGPVIPHDTFPADCSLCHAGGDWHTLREDFRFDHGKETGHELHGAHRTAECLRCHNDRGPVQSFAARGCSGCHEDPHLTRLGPRCADCHDEVSWLPQGQIAQHARTRFPLVASHAGVACMRCHPGAQVGNFQRASIRCEDCHQADLQRATDPDHAALGWTSGCERCHVPTAFGDARMDHSIYPLVGEHASTSCTSCHVNGVYRGTPRDCAACHLDDYNATTSPNHAAAGFSTTCEQCHTPRGWTGANFAHTSYPLIGEHRSTSCDACHAGGVYQGTPRDCAACHLDDYNATRDPNHAAAGFPTTCEQCHTPNGWGGARFDHTTYPLTGAHLSTSCAGCHAGGVYQGTPRDCAACHLDDYNATRDPNHAAAGFPTTCEACHTTSRWEGARFNHRFPLRGEHDVSCSTCHTNSASFQTFECTVCHAHSRARMDEKHDEVRNYVYQSQACYNCHPNGRSEERKR